MDFRTNAVLEEIRRWLESRGCSACVHVEGRPPDPPLKGDLKAWQHWAEKVLPNEMDEGREKKPVIPKNYVKKCSLEAFQQNIRWFYHKKNFPVNQALGAAYSTLRRACGVPPWAPKKLTPAQIVGSQGFDWDEAGEYECKEC